MTATWLKTIAPWTDEQVAALNRYQHNDRVHEFTCPNLCADRTLIATREGWVCACGGYRQDWAHRFMLEF